jgi:hypothetical protein
MNLELNYAETSVLLDAIYVRLKQIDRLIESFDDPVLIKIYRKEEEKLINLRTKLQTL